MKKFSKNVDAIFLQHLIACCNILIKSLKHGEVGYPQILQVIAINSIGQKCVKKVANLLGGKKEVRLTLSPAECVTICNEFILTGYTESVDPIAQVHFNEIHKIYTYYATDYLQIVKE